MKKLIPVLAALTVLSGLRCLAADDESSPSFWMQKKLQYSEGILAGLSSGDFDLMSKNAKTMNALTKIEKWVHANSAEYRLQLKSFQTANEKVIRAADEKDLDGAALAFVQLTLSCVNCHRIVRDGKPNNARLP